MAFSIRTSMASIRLSVLTVLLFLRWTAAMFVYAPVGPVAVLGTSPSST